QAKTSLAGISVTNAFAEELLRPSGKSLVNLQRTLDSGEPMMGFALPDISLAAVIDIIEEKASGTNVIAMLPAEGRYRFNAKNVIVGAHIDHLGTGMHPG